MKSGETSTENDVNNINGILLENMFPEMLSKSIENIIKGEGYVKHKFSKKPFLTNGGSYCSKLYEVDIQGETASGDKETNIFIKNIIPVNENEVFSIKEAFFKECFIYKELSVIFTELQNEARVPAEERFKMAKSFEGTTTDSIFLENLNSKGFTTLHRMDVMPLKFAEEAVKYLAKFHSLSYVLQKKKSLYFNTNLKILKQHFIYDKKWKEFYLNLCCKSMDGLSGEAKEKVEKFVQTIYDKYPLYMQDDTMSSGYTICHGDYRMGNILVKEGTDGTMTEMVPVDYQFLYYGCPVNDLLYLLFTASDQEFRKNHLENLKNLYYNHLHIFLGYFNLDVADIYPKKDFERQYTERLELGLIYVLFYLPFIFTKEDEIPDLGKDDFQTLGFIMDDRYRERVQGVVDDFINWGYL